MAKTGKRKRKREKHILLNYIRRNDVVLRIYSSFALVLGLTGVLTGLIFMRLYEKNYIRSYTTLLSNQGELIAKKVAYFWEEGKEVQFQNYSEYIDELERAENNDMWIVSKEDAKHPLGDNFVNADISSGNLAEEMYTVLNDAYKGKVSANSSYDKVYGMVTLRVAVPVKLSKTKEVIGAVMMVSMIDRQTMGVNEGKSLITLSLLLAIVIAYIVAIIFSRYLSKPLEKISFDIAKMAKGDYSKIKIRKPNSQIGILESSLDYLSAQLRKSVKERENLEQVRRDFFANVSHELRTPITVIRGYTESLADGVVQEKNQVEDMYQRMLQECRGMERLVEDLFILSKMQNPDFKIDMEPVSLVQIFSDVLRSGRMMGKEKKIQIELKAPEDDLCMVTGDYGRLRQMFMIIVDNAIKFSKEEGKIQIGISKKDENYGIYIQDFGIGISEEKLPYIFEKFYTSKMRQNEKGTGLGLMIAKQIALRHDAKIAVESTVDVGTTFYFSFKECDCISDFE